MNIVKLPQALTDLVETAEYLANEDLDLADRSFDAFEATLEQIKKTPRIGSIRKLRDNHEVRMWFVREFHKSLIF